MALTQARLEVILAWSQQKAITGFRTQTLPDSFDQSVAPTIDGTHANRPYPVQGTLAPGASVTLNLNILTEPTTGEAMTPLRAYLFAFEGVGANWTYGPNAGSPLNWFLSAGATLNGSGAGTGDVCAYGSATAATIDATHKNVTIINVDGTNTLTYTLALILGV